MLAQQPPQSQWLHILQTVIVTSPITTWCILWFQVRLKDLFIPHFYLGVIFFFKHAPFYIDQLVQVSSELEYPAQFHPLQSCMDEGKQTEKVTPPATLTACWTLLLNQSISACGVCQALSLTPILSVCSILAKAVLQKYLKGIFSNLAEVKISTRAAWWFFFSVLLLLLLVDVLVSTCDFSPSLSLIEEHL